MGGKHLAFSARGYAFSKMHSVKWVATQALHAMYAVLWLMFQGRAIRKKWKVAQTGRKKKLWFLKAFLPFGFIAT